MKLTALHLSAALGVLSTPAFAQDTSEAAPYADDVIVVTAQRRAENIQDVPISITAADAETLAEARVENIVNIAALSPSTQFVTSNNPVTSSSIVIRGIGTIGITRTFEGAVGVFIDGAYRSRAGAAIQNFLDIDSLEILRGPQGTLFGKNTAAGAVLINSTKPDPHAVGGFYEAGYGNYNALDLKAGVNLPVGENAALRLAGLYSKTDGFYTDATTGEDLNNNETAAFKGQFLFTPTDALSIRLIGDYSKSDANCCYASINYVDGPAQPLIDALTLAAGGRLPSNGPKDFQQTLSAPNDQSVSDYGATLIIDYDFDDVSLKSTTVYRSYNVDQVGLDGDFSGALVLTVDEYFTSEMFSQELTLNSDWDALNLDYVVGAYFSDEDIDAQRSLYWGPQAEFYWQTLLATSLITATPGMFTSEIMTGKARSAAIFAHGEFQLSDAFSAVAGVRYSHDKKEGSFANPYFRLSPTEAITLLGIMPGPEYDDSVSDDAISGTFSLQYYPNNDTQIYASYNRGYKAGGVNIDVSAAGGVADNPALFPGATPKDPTYQPEKINAFELGGKFQYLGGRAQTNIAGFYNDISDLQVAQFIGLQFAILNARSAESYGLEIENRFHISDYVTLQLGGTWLPYAEYGDDASVDPAISGQRFKFAPKFSGDAGINVDYPVTDDLTVGGRIQYQYSTARYIDPASLARDDAFGLLNVNMGVGSKDGQWRVEGWVNNATNTIYGTYAFLTPIQAGDENIYLGAPRTYGVTLRGAF
ncbi:MAG: TonB-dependent receptor [Parvularculaceae bacterium]|nr:TonB-dependent receptor [Caulobacterales bacterium]HRX39829.1 TonB-dependent receptor [Parvularculaceae bacterium]